MSDSQNHNFVSKGFVDDDVRKPFELQPKYAEFIGKRFKMRSGVGAVLGSSYRCVHGSEKFDSQALASILIPVSRSNRFFLGVWMNSESHGYSGLNAFRILARASSQSAS